MYLICTGEVKYSVVKLAVLKPYAVDYDSFITASIKIWSHSQPVSSIQYIIVDHLHCFLEML